MDEEFTGVESLTDLDMFIDLYVDSAELAGSAYFFSYDVNGVALRDAYSFFIDAYHPLTLRGYTDAKRILLAIAVAIYATSLFEVVTFNGHTVDPKSEVSDHHLGLPVRNANEMVALVFGIFIQQLVLRQLANHYGFEPPPRRPDLSAVTFGQFKGAVQEVAAMRNKVAGTDKPQFATSFKMLRKFLQKFW